MALGKDKFDPKRFIEETNRSQSFDLVGRTAKRLVKSKELLIPQEGDDEEIRRLREFHRVTHNTLDHAMKERLKELGIDEN